MKFSSWKFVGILILILVIIAVFSLTQTSRTKSQNYSDSVTIILSPHFDDAVLSLGGLMAKHEHPIVVGTFFTAGPEVATTTHWDQISGFKDSKEAYAQRVRENTAALKIFGVTEKNYDYADNQYTRGDTDDDVELHIAQDIQALLSAYKGKHIDVYGPGYFNNDINHPDHILLHKAFLDAENLYPDSNVSFYLYEDYPYAGRFEKQSVISIQKNYENESGKFFDKIKIPLTTEEVGNKIKSLKDYSSQVVAFTALGEDILKDTENYTLTRCGLEPKQACEIVYKFH